MDEAGNRRVLVVEDDDAIRTLVSRILRHTGFEPVEARDGQHAIEQLDRAQLDRDQFDAIVLDLMMPRVDGFGVVDHLIETQPAMVERTVVMTAYPKAAARQRLHHLCRIVSKPFNTAELLGLVRECSTR